MHVVVDECFLRLKQAQRTSQTLVHRVLGDLGLEHVLEAEGFFFRGDRQQRRLVGLQRFQGHLFGSDDDRKVFGSGLPKFNLGWNNSFHAGNLDLSFFFRGAFGHSIINENRIFYENAEPGSIKNYNRVKTKYWRDDVKEAKWTSLYIEKGDFIKLDNLTLGYNISLPQGSAFSKARVYVSGNNLATFTGYTGVDPEVRYSDAGPNDNGNVQARAGNPDPLAPGIDRRTNYYAVRSFSVGVNLGF